MHSNMNTVYTHSHAHEDVHQPQMSIELETLRNRYTI